MRRILAGNTSMESAGSVITNDASRSLGVAALRDLSFQLQDGDRLGIIGRNGSGKSTLLRVLAGVFEPQVGTVSVVGRVAALLSAGMGMQPDATGFRNIELIGLANGLSRAEIRVLAPEIAEFSGLGPYLEMPVTTYSNGMKMRLKFAACTAFDPDILLIDEWLNAGDADFRKKSEVRMNQLINTTGILVLATHKNRTILDICNKCLWLDRGCMQMFGEAKEVIDAYNSS